MPNVILKLHTDQLKKSNTNPEIFKQLFYEFITSFLDHVQLYTDGSKEGSKVGCAMVSGPTLFQCRLPDSCSIFTAELRAILLALDFISGSHHDKFLILSDSLSSLQSIKNCNVDEPLTRQILEKCHSYHELGKTISFFWVPSHVGIKGNEKADIAARTALSLPVVNFKIPYTDIKTKVKAHFVKLWQEHWNGVLFNKLKPIKPTLGFTKFTNINRRRDETVLHRLRIGHSYLTHSFLLKQNDHPECTTCACALTVEHILLHCPAFTASRLKYFNVSSLFELFNSVSAPNIVNFLKEIHLYSEI